MNVSKTPATYVIKLTEDELDGLISACRTKASLGSFPLARYTKLGNELEAVRMQ